MTSWQLREDWLPLLSLVFFHEKLLNLLSQQDSLSLFVPPVPSDDDERKGKMRWDIQCHSLDSLRLLHLVLQERLSENERTVNERAKWCDRERERERKKNSQGLPSLRASFPSLSFMQHLLWRETQVLCLFLSDSFWVPQQFIHFSWTNQGKGGEQSNSSQEQRTRIRSNSLQWRKVSVDDSTGSKLFSRFTDKKQVCISNYHLIVILCKERREDVIKKRRQAEIKTVLLRDFNGVSLYWLLWVTKDLTRLDSSCISIWTEKKRQLSSERMEEACLLCWGEQQKRRERCIYRLRRRTLLRDRGNDDSGERQRMKIQERNRGRQRKRGQRNQQMLLPFSLFFLFLESTKIKQLSGSDVHVESRGRMRGVRESGERSARVSDEISGLKF